MRQTRIARTIVLLLAVATVVAACGGGSNNGGRSSEPDPTGVLRYGQPMPVAGLHFDPTQSVLGPDVIWMSMVYGTLMRQSSDGKLEPWMAENAEVVDPQTVKFTLRPDVKFSDGAVFDAEAVKTSLMRARVPATPAAKGGQDPAMKTLADVEVVDPLTVVARLSAPMAGQFLVEMSQRNGGIVSPTQIAENPDQIDTKPIGAGPFTLETNTPNQLLAFTKNPTYWDADTVKLGGVEIVNTPTGPQQANGLLSNELDWAAYIPVDGAKRVESAGTYTTVVSSVYNVEIDMCTGKAPFDNEAVRKAVQAGIDRQRYAELAFGGYTVPAYSLFREDNQNFAPAAKEIVKYDPDQARSLLASSGAGDVSFDLHYSSASVTGGEAEVLQSQLQAIGVKTEIIPERDLLSGFINPQKPGATILTTIGATGYVSFNRFFGPGGNLSLCGVDRPAVMAAVNEAASLTPDDPKAIAAYQKAQEIIAEHAYTIPIVAYPTIAGWNTARVGGTPVFTAQGYPEFDSVYISR